MADAQSPGAGNFGEGMTSFPADKEAAEPQRIIDRICRSNTRNTTDAVPAVADPVASRKMMLKCIFFLSLHVNLMYMKLSGVYVVVLPQQRF